MTLGQKLKKLRTDKGLTQKDLADQLHVTFQTISKWESDLNEPDIATLKELAKLYDCSVDYLINEDEEEQKETEVIEQPVVAPVEQVTKTIIIHQNEAHVCAKCGEDIAEEDLVSEDITQKERYGRVTRTVTVGQTYYHKACLDEIKKERAEKAKKERLEKASKNKVKCFGWSIAVGSIGLTIALLFLFMTPELRELFHPAIAILIAIGISYALFSMVYCIVSGSYIGDVFTWCAGLSIKFPMIIFSWDLGGLIWLIGMKILFAVLGFFIGVLALMFAIAFSSTLGIISFPFVLIHNINTDYEDTL